MCKKNCGAKLRVLHVFNSVNIGGAETMVMNYYRNINRDNIQFDFVTHVKNYGFYKDEIKKLGGNLYFVPKFHGYNILSCFLAWRKIFHDLPNDCVVHGHMSSTACLYLLLARIYNRYPIAHSHSNNKNNEDGIIRYFLRRFLYLCTRLVARQFYGCSIESGVNMYGENIVSSSRFSVWYNAIDYKKFRYSSVNREEMRDKFGLRENDILIGHVGRMTWAKNHEFLLKVFQELYHEYPNVYLLLIGDGEELEKVKNLARKLHIDRHVIFLGAVQDVEKYLSAMDLFLFPSRYEGLPTSVIEAQVNGLNCIVSDVVTRDVDITSNKQVRFLSITNIDGWVNCINELMKSPRLNLTDLDNKYDIKYAVKWAENEYEKIVT